MYQATPYRFLLVLSLSLTFQVASITLVSQSVSTFTGTADPHNWNDSKNWDPNGVPLNGEKVIINGDSVYIEGIQPNLHSIEIIDGALLNRESIILFNQDTFGIRCLRSNLINDGTIHILASGGETYVYRAARAGINLELSQFINKKTVLVEDSGYGLVAADNSTIDNQFDIEVNSTATSILLSFSSFLDNSQADSHLSANRNLQVTFGSTIANRGDLSCLAAEIAQNSQFDNYGIADISNTRLSSPAFQLINARFFQYNGGEFIAKSFISGHPIVRFENNSDVLISANSKLSVDGRTGLDKIEIIDSSFDCMGELDVN